MLDLLLQKTDNRLKEIVDNVGEVFWLRDVSDDSIIYMNTGFENLWGISCNSIYDRAFPVLDEDGNIVKVAGMAVDITKQKEFELTLEVLINMAKTFINIPIEDLDSEVNKALELMGKFVNADRTYIFNYDFSSEVCKNIFEWCEDGISPEIDNLQKVPLEIIPEWVSSHKANKEMCIEDVFSMPKDNGIRQILEPQGVKSILTLPLMENGELWGFVGFDSVKERHHCLEKERNLLSVFCELLVNVRSRVNTLKEISKAKLDFSKIEAGKLELEIVEADIVELIYESIDIVKYEANQKNIELILDITLYSPRVIKIDPCIM